MPAFWQQCASDNVWASRKAFGCRRLQASGTARPFPLLGQVANEGGGGGAKKYVHLKMPQGLFFTYLDGLGIKLMVPLRHSFFF